MESIKAELLSCKQKLKLLAIPDYAKLLPLTKTTSMKNQVLSLQDMVEKAEFDVEREKNDIHLQMDNLRHDIATLRQKFKQADSSALFYQQVQTLSTSIEDSVVRFKDRMSDLFDQIANEEEQITYDLQLIEDKVSHYESTPTITRAPQPVESRPPKVPVVGASQTDDIKQRIERIEERIKLNGGKSGGWEDEDHQEFLRLRTKHQGRITTPQFVVDCVKCIPMHTEDEIREHIDRYSKYLDLEDAKKNLVEQYKKSRQQQKEFLIQQAQLEEQVKQEFEQKNKKSKEQLEEERQRQKEQLQQWKAKRTSQKVVESEMQEEQKREYQRMQWEQKQQEREAKKYLVEQYKEQKQLQQLRERESEQFQQMVKRHVSSDAKARIKEREDYMTDRRRSKLEQDRKRQQDRELQKQQIQEQKSHKFAYVEPKLLEVTKAAQQHQRDKFNPAVDQGKYADTFGGNLLGNGRRAVPSWRQGAQF